MSEPEEAGITVVTVTWNTIRELQVLLRAVAVFTDQPVHLIVVDNASSDGTQEFLDQHPEIQVIRLRRNWGHGLALDAGVQAARTRFVVTLDVDAFPISSSWLACVIEPLTEGYSLAGAWSSGYVHPCFLAIERRRFLAGKHTFAASYSRRLRLRRRGDPRGWDAGKLITIRDPGPHFRIEATSVRGPSALGTVFGGVVYHHFYSTRLGTPVEDVIRSGVTREISREAWIEAVGKYLPPETGVTEYFGGTPHVG
ncbi:glycosyltransferase, partial [bacterium]|nr:glycosyltransferase [bacterium]